MSCCCQGTTQRILPARDPRPTPSPLHPCLFEFGNCIWDSTVNITAGTEHVKEKRSCFTEKTHLKQGRNASLDVRGKSASLVIVLVTGKHTQGRSPKTGRCRRVTAAVFTELPYLWLLCWPINRTTPSPIILRVILSLLGTHFPEGFYSGVIHVLPFPSSTCFSTIKPSCWLVSRTRHFCFHFEVFFFIFVCYFHSFSSSVDISLHFENWQHL